VPNIVRGQLNRRDRPALSEVASAIGLRLARAAADSQITAWPAPWASWRKLLFLIQPRHRHRDCISRSPTLVDERVRSAAAHLGEEEGDVGPLPTCAKSAFAPILGQRNGRHAIVVPGEGRSIGAGVRLSPSSDPIIPRTATHPFLFCPVASSTSPCALRRERID